MSGVLGPGLVEHVPDAVVILVVDAAGDKDARALRQEDLGLGPALRVDEVAAVDDGGSHGAVVDLRARKRLPGGAGGRLEQLSRMVAHELEGNCAAREASGPGR